MDIKYAAVAGPEHQRDAVWTASASSRRSFRIMAAVLFLIAAADILVYATRYRPGPTGILLLIVLIGFALGLIAYPFVAVRTQVARYATEDADDTTYRITEEEIVRSSGGDRELRPWAKITRAQERDGLLHLYRDGSHVAFRLCRHCMGEPAYAELRTFLVNRHQLRPLKSTSKSS